MKKTIPALVSALFLIGVSSLYGKELILHAVQYPEDRKVSVGFAAGENAAGAELDGKVEYVKGRAQIALEAENLTPAVLLGGDVTSYVLWGVTRTGAVENLGELWVRTDREKVRFTSGLKEFALLVSAEIHPLVDRPSELVIFRSLRVDRRGSKSTPFSFHDFAPPPAHGGNSIAGLEYAGEKPLFLIQAEKVFELAREQGAEAHAAPIYHDAEVTLAQSRNLAAASKHELALDYARRSLALSSEALRLLARQREAAALEARILERREDVRELETASRELSRQVLELETEKAELETEKAELEADKAELETEKAILEASFQALERDKQALEADNRALEIEKKSLAARTESLRRTAEGLRGDNQALEENLHHALSEIAETRSTARGLIVTLPDILFDVDRATLKPEARTTLAKLAGVLQLVPGVELEIEGHTDSTGTDAHNLDLSRQRAESVRSFLAAEGVSGERMSARGFGEERPVATNDTAEGRGKNRRVEVILPQDESANRVSDASLTSRKRGEP